MATLGQEMTGKILSSSPPQSPVVKQDDQVQIRETFIDPTEEVDLEHNFERLGKGSLITAVAEEERRQKE